MSEFTDVLRMDDRLGDIERDVPVLRGKGDMMRHDINVLSERIDALIARVQALEGK